MWISLWLGSQLIDRPKIFPLMWMKNLNKKIFFIARKWKKIFPKIEPICSLIVGSVNRSTGGKVMERFPYKWALLMHLLWSPHFIQCNNRMLPGFSHSQLFEFWAILNPRLLDSWLFWFPAFWISAFPDSQLS